MYIKKSNQANLLKKIDLSLSNGEEECGMSENGHEFLIGMMDVQLGIY